MRCAVCDTSVLPWCESGVNAPKPVPYRGLTIRADESEIAGNPALMVAKRNRPEEASLLSRAPEAREEKMDRR